MKVFDHNVCRYGPDAQSYGMATSLWKRASCEESVKKAMEEVSSGLLLTCDIGLLQLHMIWPSAPVHMGCFVLLCCTVFNNHPVSILQHIRVDFELRDIVVVCVWSQGQPVH